MDGFRSSSKSPPTVSTHFGLESKWSLSGRPVLAWIADAILVALIVVFPFIMGGREAWGHQALITLATALGFVWCLHQARSGGRLIFLRLEPLLLAGLLLVWLQTVPLDQGTLNSLSPEYERLLPGWSATQSNFASDAAKASASAVNGKPSLPSNSSAPDQPVAAWSFASLYPTETRHALLMLISYGIIAVVVAQRLKSEDDCHNLLKLVAISGVLMAAFAVIQLVTSNDRFFWFYQQPHTGTREVLKGAFTNRNHFAQFLSLAIGPLIWWMLIDRASKSGSDLSRSSLRGAEYGSHSRFDKIINPKFVLLICATGGVVLSIMLSLSRGGMISAGLACIVCLAGLWKSGRVKGSVAYIILTLGVFAIIGLTVFGQDGVEERIGQLASGNADEIDRLNARRSIWKADIAAIRAFPLVGTGVGSHRFVYPIYMEDLAKFVGVSFSHAESSYINLALETGLIGLGLLILGLIAVLGRIFLQLIRTDDSGRVAALAAILASLVGGVAHAAVDFIWYAPAIVVSTIMLSVAGLRMCSGFSAGQGIRVPRICWFVAGVVCLFLLCRVQPELQRRIVGERLWFQYLIAEFNAAGSDAAGFGEHRQTAFIAEQAERSIDTLFETDAAESGIEPGDAGIPGESAIPNESVSSHAQLEARAESLRSRIRLLMASLNANPDQAEANLHLGLRCLDLFELLQTQSDNRMPLSQIRETVLQSHFKSNSEMYAFLKRAFGTQIRLALLSDQFCRRSLKLCPLSDRSWQTLVSTNFLRDPSDQRHGSMMAQTLLTGGHSPRIRQSVGLTLLRDGRTQEALRHLAVAFHSSPEMRFAVCKTLVRAQPVDVVLNQFQPSADELAEVLAVCREFGRTSDVRKVTWLIAEKIRQPESGSAIAAIEGKDRHVALLMEAYRAAYELQIRDQCEQLLELAIDCDPTAEPPRRALGLLMLEQQNYGAAELHFAWCHQQMPGDEKLEELRRDCRRMATKQSRRIIQASFENP